MAGSFHITGNFRNRMRSNFPSPPTIIRFSRFCAILRVAWDALPALELPSDSLSYPQDARAHIGRRRASHEKDLRVRAARGMWPSEGAISDASLNSGRRGRIPLAGFRRECPLELASSRWPCPRRPSAGAEIQCLRFGPARLSALPVLSRPRFERSLRFCLLFLEPQQMPWPILWGDCAESREPSR